MEQASFKGRLKNSLKSIFTFSLRLQGVLQMKRNTFIFSFFGNLSKKSFRSYELTFIFCRSQVRISAEIFFENFSWCCRLGCPGIVP